MASTWEEHLEAAQRRMRATGGPTTPHRRPRPHRGVAWRTARDRRRTLLRLAGPPPEEAA